jgi:deoxycytidylate deaminase
MTNPENMPWIEQANIESLEALNQLRRKSFSKMTTRVLKSELLNLDVPEYDAVVVEEVAKRLQQFDNLTKILGLLAPGGTAPRTAIEEIYKQSADNADESQIILDLRQMLHPQWGEWTPALRKAEGFPEKIEYPYMPENGVIHYVGADNDYMVLAKEYARRESLDKVMPNCSIIVKNDQILGIGANGSNYHENNECERVKIGSKTGEDYDKCEGCHPKNHGEIQALTDALAYDNDLEGAEVYLWGHWWCCQPCWDAMQSNGINTVYLLQDSEILFNRENADNVIGHQFET